GPADAGAGLRSAAMRTQSAHESGADGPWAAADNVWSRSGSRSIGLSLGSLLVAPPAAVLLLPPGGQFVELGLLFGAKELGDVGPGGGSDRLEPLVRLLVQSLDLRLLGLEDPERLSP